MPNHVKNRLEILGTKEQVKEVVNAFNIHHPASLNRAHDGSIICKEKNTEKFSVGWFNEKTGMFNRRGMDDVLGLPEGWDFEIEKAFDHFPNFEKVIPQPDNIFRGDLGKKEEEMCKREGRPTWLGWNRDNWGTKWNSYNCEKVDSNIYTFDTAWNGVPILIEALSKQYPDIEFIYEYSCEDTGYNTGIYKLKNGIVNEEHPENGSKEAYELAFKIRPHYKDDYVLTDGNWEYKDED